MFTLPNLKFNPEKLNPAISAETISFHHGKHHATYVNKLNELLQDNTDFLKMELADLLHNIENLPENLQTSVFNNAGQHYNHTLYWESITDVKNTQPNVDLMQEINQDFGSFEEFKKQFGDAGLMQFGSGWAWLSVDNITKKLVIDKTLNADSPIFKNKTPILTMDVWEHAYYLDYQNKRAEYIENFFSVLNWESANEKFANTK
jgi:superoxide dismutase, Fe-Mn family